MPRSEKVALICDECVGVTTVKFLRDLGHNLLTIQEINFSGKSDAILFQWATANNRVLLTEDTDFGNILLFPPSFHKGIILLRFRRKAKMEIHASLKILLQETAPAEFNKTLFVVDAEGYRMRRE